MLRCKNFFFEEGCLKVIIIFLFICFCIYVIFWDLILVKCKVLKIECVDVDFDGVKNVDLGWLGSLLVVLLCIEKFLGGFCNLVVWVEYELLLIMLILIFKLVLFRVEVFILFFKLILILVELLVGLFIVLDLGILVELFIVEIGLFIILDLLILILYIVLDVVVLVFKIWYNGEGIVEN